MTTTPYSFVQYCSVYDHSGSISSDGKTSTTTIVSSTNMKIWEISYINELTTRDQSIVGEFVDMAYLKQTLQRVSLDAFVAWNDMTYFTKTCVTLKRFMMVK